MDLLRSSISLICCNIYTKTSSEIIETENKKLYRDDGLIIVKKKKIEISSENNNKKLKEV